MHLDRRCGYGGCVNRVCVERVGCGRGCVDGGVHPPLPLVMATEAVGTHPTGMHSCDVYWDYHRRLIQEIFSYKLHGDVTHEQECAWRGWD